MTQIVSSSKKVRVCGAIMKLMIAATNNPTAIKWAKSDQRFRRSGISSPLHHA
jgi:hypothetical protein